MVVLAPPTNATLHSKIEALHTVGCKDQNSLEVLKDSQQDYTDLVNVLPFCVFGPCYRVMQGSPDTMVLLCISEDGVLASRNTSASSLPSN